MDHRLTTAATKSAQLLAVSALLLAASAAPAKTMAGPFTAAETSAIYKAAGFAVKAGFPLGCNTGNPDWPASSFSIEAVDLSADGKPEAVITEGNAACYGGDESAFIIVAKSPDGSWHKIGAGNGGYLPLKTKHNGWFDIEYGGPGTQKHPVMHWDGKAYQ